MYFTVDPIREKKNKGVSKVLSSDVISCNRVIFPPQTHVSGPYPVLKVLKVGYCTTYTRTEIPNMRYPFLDRRDAMPLAHCIRPDHTEGETKYHDVEFKTNIVV